MPRQCLGASPSNGGYKESPEAVKDELVAAFNQSLGVPLSDTLSSHCLDISANAGRGKQNPTHNYTSYNAKSSPLISFLSHQEGERLISAAFVLFISYTKPKMPTATPKITLYTSHECPYAHRVHIVLKELGLTYVEVMIDLSQPRDEWYLKINPVCLHF
jgi:hypothetical protein